MNYNDLLITVVKMESIIPQMGTQWALSQPSWKPLSSTLQISGTLQDGLNLSSKTHPAALPCRSTKVSWINGHLRLKQHKGQISTAQERNTNTRTCSDSHKSTRLPPASLPTLYSNSQVVPCRRTGKKFEAGAVEAQQIYGASSQLSVEKSSVYSLVCLHTGDIKKKNKEIAKSIPCDNVLTD